MQYFPTKMSRSLSADDDLNTTTGTNQMLNTLYINIIIFSALVLIFECSRGIKSLYLNRLLVRKYVDSNRVPAEPSICPFSWVFILLSITEDEVCRMAGLDAYMLLRFITICMRMGLLLSVCGLIFLVPIYATSPGQFVGWNKFTLANIPNGPSATELWSPVIFCYLFSGCFCQLLYYEYKHFIKKRVEYLVAGDMDTPIQAYYTAMIEKLPKEIRSAPALLEYCEKLFNGDVFSVEIAVDLKELEALIARRHEVRNDLEKAIAVWHASGRRPTLTIKEDFYQDFPPPVPTPLDPPKGLSAFLNSLCCRGKVIVVDSIDHNTKVLEMMNESVIKLQEFYYTQRQQEDDSHSELRFKRMKKILEKKTSAIVSSVGNKLSNLVSPLESRRSHSDEANQSQSLEEAYPTNSVEVSGEIAESSPNPLLDNEAIDSVPPVVTADDSFDNKKTASEGLKGTVINIGSTISDATKSGAIMVGEATKHGVEGLAKEGLKTAKFATKGAMKALYEATRALELLTLGEQLKVSTTAFVTFKSRLAACSSHQILLSNKFYKMRFQPAPNPQDIIWKNITISKSQIELRKWIADLAFQFGAIFWSIVVAFIATISNLDSISQVIPAIQQYSSTEFYILLNDYLALGLLVIILAVLPFVFDFVSRYYEGIKLESEIQNSIMTRYFYYLLANVYVAIGLGSIATSLNSIINSPTSILTILGLSLPSFSVYFTNLVIIKTFTGIPLEMLRVFPLLDIARVSVCINKKTVTRREMRTGAFADPPMLYGWIYPNLLMILMIMLTYSCIAPLTVPFCLLFFVLAYFMYKYQLLYVYINESQSGGFMWYAVFNRSMVALLCGVLVLLCYLLIRETFFTGPFYLLFPLPFTIILFWYRCNKEFKGPAMLLSLEEAVQIDRKVEEVARESGTLRPQESFTSTLYRQPSLVEGPLKPEAYRHHVTAEPPASPSPSSPSTGTNYGKNSSSFGGAGTTGEHYYSKFASGLDRQYYQRPSLSLKQSAVAGYGTGNILDEETGSGKGGGSKRYDYRRGDDASELESKELEEQIDQLLGDGDGASSPSNNSLRNSFGERAAVMREEVAHGIAVMQQQFRNSNVSSVFRRPKKGPLEEELLDKH